jgi:hypothetical protein
MKRILASTSGAILGFLASLEIFEPLYNLIWGQSHEGDSGYFWGLIVMPILTVTLAVIGWHLPRLLSKSKK